MTINLQHELYYKAYEFTKMIIIWH